MEGGGGEWRCIQFTPLSPAAMALSTQDLRLLCVCKIWHICHLYIWRHPVWINWHKPSAKYLTNFLFFSSSLNIKNIHIIYIGYPIASSCLMSATGSWFIHGQSLLSEEGRPMYEISACVLGLYRNSYRDTCFSLYVTQDK